MSTYTLNPIVDTLWSETLDLVGPRADRLGRHRLPSRPALAEIMDRLRAAFFPGHFGAADLSRESGRFYVGSQLDAALQALEEQVLRVTIYASACGDSHTCEKRARELTAAFAEALPRIRRLLATDVQAAFDGDPAASSVDEAVFCYPGINALVHHRLAHELYRLGVPLAGHYVEIFYSDSAHYGGSNLGKLGGVEAWQGEWMNRPANLELTLPPLSAVVLRLSQVG